jgi:coenzyme F420-0:L-glutamate ligase / coenzyme F420-1:gamma-L-glutamate ligase
VYNLHVEILPIYTRPLAPHDNLVEELLKNAPTLQPNDIIVVSSKVIALTEDVAISLDTLIPSTVAKTLSLPTVPPSVAEAIIRETTRLNGRIIPGCPYAILTELRPAGLDGSLLVPNAGLDQSNTLPGTVIGWPQDVVKSVKRLQRELFTRTGLHLGVLISDSCCHLGRLGVVAMGLACAGFDPIRSLGGQTDLQGRALRITNEAVADQLATAANMIMGNDAQSIPAAIIRNHGVALSKYLGWVPSMEPREDLFAGLLRQDVLTPTPNC